MTTTHHRKPPIPAPNPCQRPGCGDGAFLHNGPAGECSVAFCGCQEFVPERLFPHTDENTYPDDPRETRSHLAAMEDRVERLEGLVAMLLRRGKTT